MLDKKVIMAEFSDVRFDDRVLKEANTLSKNGYCIILHMYNTSVNKDTKEHKGNIEYFIYGFKSRLYNDTLWSIIKKYFCALKILLKINTWILFHKADIYHAHNLNFLFISFLASIIYKAKLVYDAHEIHSEHYNNNFNGRIKNKFSEYLEKLILLKCNVFIQASDERAEFIANKYKIPKPFVINNYVPLKDIVTGNNKLRNELGLENYPIMFYSGGVYLGGGRKFANIIEALKEIEKIYFIIIGFMNETIKQQIEDLLNSYSLKLKVFILPPVPHNLLFEYASSADIGIIPLAGNSINTKLSALNKVSEYLMSGLPILCSDYENLKKIIYENPIGKIGETFNVESSKSIANAINKIIENDNYKILKYNAVKLAHDYFNWETEEKKLVDIYKSLKIR